MINIRFRYIVQSKAKPKGSKWKSAKTFKFKSGELRASLHRTRLGALSDLKLWKYAELGKFKKYRHSFRVRKIELKAKKGKYKAKKSKSKKRKK